MKFLIAPFWNIKKVGGQIIYLFRKRAGAAGGDLPTKEELLLLYCRNVQYSIVLQKYPVCSSNRSDFLHFPHENSNLNYDSGWQELTIAAGFRKYGSTARYRKIGSRVIIDAALSPTADTPSAEAKVMCSLPTAYAPISDISIICQGSGANRWNLTINPDGKLWFGRYGTTEMSTAPAGCWLPFSAEYTHK